MEKIGSIALAITGHLLSRTSLVGSSSIQSIEQFARDLIDQEIEKIYRSDDLRRPNGLSPVDQIVRRPGLNFGPFIFDSRGILWQVDGLVEVECHTVPFDRVWPSTSHTGSPSCRRFAANPAPAKKGMPRRLPTLWLGWTSFSHVPTGRGVLRG